MPPQPATSPQTAADAASAQYRRMASQIAPAYGGDVEIAHSALLVRTGQVRPRVPDSDLFEGELRPYQHVGVSVLSLTPTLILGDMTGLGKTVQLLRYLVRLVENGTVTGSQPAIVVVHASALDSSWEADGFRTFTPSLGYVKMTGELKPKERRSLMHAQAFPVLLYNYATLRRDAPYLLEAYDSFGALIADEASEFRGGSKSVTQQRMQALAGQALRVVAATATPIQSDLMDIHSIMTGIGLGDVVGPVNEFNHRYFNRVYVERRIPGGRKIGRWEVDKARPHGHLDELRAKLWPYFFRRTYSDIPGEMPELTVRTEWVDLHENQRAVYERIRRGPAVQRGPGFSLRLRARAAMLRQAATATGIVDRDSPNSSSKFDWLVSQLRGEWSDGGVVVNSQGARPTKVVVYSTWKDGVLALKQRLDAEGIGSVVMAGTSPLPNGDPFPYGTTPAEREPLRQRFFEDGDCQVCIGTSALEMGVNLHAAPVLVALDTLRNPARMSQIIGRIWRMSSPYRFVVAINVLTRGTVEEGLMRTIAERQSLIDFMNAGQGAEGVDVLSAMSDEDIERLVSTDWRDAA